MAYDEELDERVGGIVSQWGATRKKMFGGTGYLIDGNMVGGVHDGRVILRLSPDEGEAALREPGVTVFDIPPRPMAGWVMVERDAVEGDELERWLERALAYVRTLPPK